MPGLLFVFVVAFLASAVVLWGGTFILQAYFYSNPTPDLIWRAPLAAAVVTAFLAFWTILDYRQPGSFNTLFEFRARDDQVFDKFWSVKNKQEIPYAAHKLGQGRVEYRDNQGKAWARSDTEGLVEAIVIEDKDGHKTRFVAETKDGKFVAKQGEPVRYKEEGGKRVMTDTYIGQLSVTRWGLVIGNILLNFGHLIAWWLVLCLILRFQWSHALGLALALWAMFMFVLPALFTKAENVAKLRAAQTAQVSKGERRGVSPPVLALALGRTLSHGDYTPARNLLYRADSTNRRAYAAPLAQAFRRYDQAPTYSTEYA